MAGQGRRSALGVAAGAGLAGLFGPGARCALRIMPAAIASVGALPAARAAGPRIALVIGNSLYPGGNRLENPGRDAQAIGSTLASMGFEVELRQDLTAAEMQARIEAFYRRGRDAEGTLFFFAGHGKQVRGVNVLLPIDVPLTRRGEPVPAGELLERAVALDDVIARAGSAPANWNLIVVDACRDKTAPTRGIGGLPGFRPVAAPRGTLVAFSTAPGARARDGVPGSNGLYTRHLLQHLKTPGIAVEEMFKRVRAGVFAETAAEQPQVPWESTSLIGELRLAGAASP